MGETTEKLSVRMDVDLSGLEDKIDALFERLTALKKEIDAVSIKLSGAQASAKTVAIKAYSLNRERESADKTVQDAVRKALRRQAAAISR